MPWITSKDKVKSHKCDVPNGFFKHDEKLTTKSRWQCPECFRVYEVESDWYSRNSQSSKYFRRQKVGNEYWYYVEMDEA